MDRATRACAETVRALREAGVPPEGLAEYVPEGRRLLVLRRAATMRPLGEVWRLGALLLDTGGQLYAAGRATRAAERGRVGHQSVSREERRDIAAAALRGGYLAGAAVNFDAVALPIGVRGPGGGDPAAYSAGAAALAALPVGFHGGAVRVRWRAGASLDGAPTLEQYLAERAALLIAPPLGAS